MESYGSNLVMALIILILIVSLITVVLTLTIVRLLVKKKDTIEEDPIIYPGDKKLKPKKPKLKVRQKSKGNNNQQIINLEGGEWW